MGAVAVPTTVSPGAQTQASLSFPCSQARRFLRSAPASCADAEAAAVVLCQKGVIPPPPATLHGVNCGDTVPCHHQPLLHQWCHMEQPCPCGLRGLTGDSVSLSSLGSQWVGGRECSPGTGSPWDTAVYQTSLMRNCQSPSKPWQATRMSTMFITLLCFPSFLGAAAFLSYTIWS